jgi:DNA primase large subunit
LQNIFINSFPFSRNAAEHLRELDIDIRTLPDEFPASFTEAFQRIQDLLDNKGLTDTIDISLTSPEVIIYAIMRVFIELLKFNLLRNRFAEAYSKRTEKLLLRSRNPKSMITLAQTTFKWVLKQEEHISTRKFNWKLRFQNFLDAAPTLMAKDWKLINQDMQNGWVSLTREKLIRLLAEKTKLYILSRKIPKSAIPKLPPTYDPYLKPLKTKISILRKEFEAQKIYSDEVMKKAYPPCVNSVLQKAENGRNLAHAERLFLTFFLLNIGRSVSEVVDVFKNQPDFREDMTRYQVEFAAGKRGGGTKYTSFGCPKLISYGICKRELDSWCEKGLVFKKPLKNPLSYYNAKIFLSQLDKNKAKKKL